jgi:hypothetical protein
VFLFYLSFLFIFIASQLSDKYDRDRLALPARSKQRDAAPHLAAGASRLGAQTQLDNAASRRVEARDAGKKKVGESNEDWRRGLWPLYPYFFNSSSTRCRIATWSGRP